MYFSLAAIRETVGNFLKPSEEQRQIKAAWAEETRKSLILGELLNARGFGHIIGHKSKIPPAIFDRMDSTFRDALLFGTTDYFIRKTDDKEWNVIGLAWKGENVTKDNIVVFQIRIVGEKPNQRRKQRAKWMEFEDFLESVLDGDKFLKKEESSNEPPDSEKKTRLDPQALFSSLRRAEDDVPDIDYNGFYEEVSKRDAEMYPHKPNNDTHYEPITLG